MRVSRWTVQARRASSFGRFLPRVIANERHEAAAFQHFGEKLAAVLFDELQLLVVGVAHGNNHAAALRKLRQQWLRSRRRRSGNEDCVERRKFRQAERAVSAMHVRVEVDKALELFGSGGSQLGAALDGENFFG